MKLFERPRYLQGEGGGEGGVGGGAGEGGEGGGGEGGGGEGGGAPVADWATIRSALPSDLSAHPSIEKFGGTEDLARGYVELEKLVGGDKVTKPGEHSTVEDWARYYSALGRPEAADQYDLGDFAPPEGVPWDDDLQAGMLQDLFDAGATDMQVNRVMRAYAERSKSMYGDAQTALNEAGEAADQELRQKWGQAYDANQELAQRVFATAFGEDAEAIANIQLPDGRLVGDHPLFRAGMYELGSRMSEGSLVSGGAAPGVSPEAALAQLAQMENDPVQSRILTERNHPEHKALSQKRDALYNQAYPEEA